MRLLAVAVILAACGGALPRSDGPYAVPEPKASVVTLAGSTSWRDTEAAIVRAAPAQRTVYVAVVDGAGATHAIALARELRLTGVINADETDAESPEGNDFAVAPKGAGIAITHAGRDILEGNVAATIERLFATEGFRYFPPGETPTKAELPIRLRVGAAVPLARVVALVSTIARGGYPAVLAILE